MDAMEDEQLDEILSKFNVDTALGFVLRDPLTALPKQFQQWHSIADEMPELIESGQIDERIAALPLISVDELKSHKELRLAHVLLVTLAAAHVWNEGTDQARLLIPKQIAVPLAAVSERLGLKPIVCHASACLANWKRDERVVESGPFKAENVSLIAFRFTRHPGNDWFFTLTAQMESELAPGLVAIAKACCDRRIHCDTFNIIQSCLRTAAATFLRMKERLPPDVFYNGFRVFLAGYTNGVFVHQGGIILEGREELGAQLLNGGSAAQSSALHVYDAFLSIEHSGAEREFLKSQWSYMPPEHSGFIAWVGRRAPLVKQLRDHEHYKPTVEVLRFFRCEHIKVVTSYIVLPSQASNPGVGTGGTSFMKLLKNIRNDC